MRGGINLKRYIRVFILFFLLVLFFGVISFSEDYSGKYHGNMTVTSINENTLNAIVSAMRSDDIEVNVNELRSDIMESYTLYFENAELLLKTDGYYMRFDEGEFVKVDYNNNKLYIREYDSESTSEFSVVMSFLSNGNLDGTYVVKNNFGELVRGKIVLYRNSSINIVETDSTDSTDSTDLADSTDSNTSELDEDSNSATDITVDEKDEGFDKEDIINGMNFTDDELEYIDEVLNLDELDDIEIWNDNIDFFDIDEDLSTYSELLDDNSFEFQDVEEKIKNVSKVRDDIDVEKSLNGVFKVSKKDSENKSYKVKKEVIKFEKEITEKYLSEGNLKYVAKILDNTFKDSIFDRDDKIEETKENLGMNKIEARAYNDFNEYDEREAKYSLLKDYVVDKIGKPAEILQKGLDKLANAKKKALGKAAAREYKIFAKEYLEAKKSKLSNKKALKRAYDRIIANGEDALESGEEYMTFANGSSNFFKEPIKFMSYKLLGRDSNSKTYKERAVKYIAYMKEDKLFFKDK